MRNSISKAAYVSCTKEADIEGRTTFTVNKVKFTGQVQKIKVKSPAIMGNK
jgi:hypothetical protein